MTSFIQKLIEAYKPENYQEHYPKDEPKIQVDLLVSKIASFYEKIRNAVDYRAEHLLRKNAVHRILKRKILVEKEGVSEKIAHDIIVELIRARYLENDHLPETKISETTNIINKYLKLIELILFKKSETRRETTEWLAGLAACEIEENLIPPKRENALIEAMYAMVSRNIIFVDESGLRPNQKGIIIYIAVRRALMKSDDFTLSYYLLRIYYPAWKEASSLLIQTAAKNIFSLKKNIEERINDRLVEKLSRRLKKVAVYFLILRDVLIKNQETNFTETLTNNQVLAEKIKAACEERYKSLRTKLNRAARRSVIYIFITKMLLAIMLEIPYDIFISQKVTHLPLIINVVFHPLLLVLMVLTVPNPTKRNTEKIIRGIEGIIYDHKNKKIVFRSKRISNLLLYIFNAIYSIMFIITFGLLIIVLRKLEFTFLGSFLFVLFLSIISFFAIRIRELALELNVLKRKQGFFIFLMQILSLPIIRVGRFISLKFSKINIFIFVFDFIIEAPFKILIEIAEQLIAMIREKREEVY